MTMTSIKRILLPPALLILLLRVNPIHANGSCSLCFGNAQATNLSGVIFGTPCETLNTTATGLPADVPFCANLQLEAFKGCGCPSYPDSFCAMCDNDEFNLPASSMLREITLSAIGRGVLCGDAVFPRRSTGLCDEYRRARAFCGCPNHPTPSCHAVCEPPLGVTARSTSEPTPAADRLLPPNFNMSCQDMHEQSPYYFAVDECNALQDPSYDLIDESTYCCSNSAPPQPANGCNLCSNTELTNPTRLVTVHGNIQMTCQDLQNLAFVVEDSSYCQSFIQQPDFESACCLGLSDPPSGAPSLSPSDTPSASPSTAAPTSEPTGDTAIESGQTALVASKATHMQWTAYWATAILPMLLF